MVTYLDMILSAVVGSMGVTKENSSLRDHLATKEILILLYGRASKFPSLDLRTFSNAVVHQTPSKPKS